jgi:fibro-slime domain-containing protein
VSSTIRPRELVEIFALEAACLCVMLTVTACSPIDRGETTRAAGSGNGPGGTGFDSGAWGAGSDRGGLVADGGLGVDDAGGVCGRALRAVIRDFRGWPGPAGEPKHPDFEYVISDETGIVATELGADDKPVYAHTGPTVTTNGPDAYNQWYRDVAGVNLKFEYQIALTEDPARPGTFLYDNDAYFPIDDQGWGNQFQSHNFDFTSEVHFNFPYRGGEHFTFRGDDDVWVFVNGHLAIDLGGVHSAKTSTIDLDARATDLGISPGHSYRMDIFHAERHVIASTFHIETTLQCIDNVIIP